MQQSPKSQRSHGPGESPSSDNNPEVVKGGTHSEHHNPSGSSKPSVPSMDRSTSGKHQGNESNVAQPVETHPSTPSQAGKARYAPDPHLGPKGGGSEHQT